MQISHVEVPAEIVGIIAHHLICIEGLQEAWKLRLVCTTFASAIKDDALLYQTKDVLGVHPSKTIMLHLMPEYLYYQVRKPLDIMNGLSAKVLEMHSYICQERKVANHEMEKRLRDLCAEMVQTITFPVLHRFMWDEPTSDSYCDLHYQWCGTVYCSRLTVQEKIDAAMVLRAYELQEGLLDPETNYDMEIRRMNPLVAAVAIDDQDSLRVILDHVKEKEGSSTPMSLDIHYAMKLAITRQSIDSISCLAPFLWKPSRSFISSKDMYVQSLRDAVKSTQRPNVDVVRQILLHCPFKPRVSSDVFLHACRTGNLDIVKVLLSEGQIDVNKGNSRTLPLLVAIKTSDITIIGALLDAGADINKTDYGNTKPAQYCGAPAHNQTPLEFAADHSMIAFKYLLKRGAVVRHVDLWYTISEEDSYNVLRKARMKQTGDVVPTFLKSQGRVRKDWDAYQQSEEDRLEKQRRKYRI